MVVFGTGDGPSRSGVTTLDELAVRAPHGAAADHAPDPFSVADVIYTSGTTGNPKGVLLTHDMLLRTAYGSAYHRAFQDGRTLLFSLPLYHVYGYVEGLLAVPFVGGAIVPQLVFDPAETLRAIERLGVDDVLLVPTMTLDVLAELRRGRYDVSGLTGLFSSGGQAPDRMWQEIVDLIGPDELVTGYGMSETTASTTCTEPGGTMARLRFSQGRYKDAGAAGRSATERRPTSRSADS